MFEDEEAKQRKTSHEIGSDLSAVSIDELRERIAVLQAEIARLETEITRKEASRNAAASFFKA